ncbi:hypothetical protein ACFSSC_10335 [Corynebacterium mendelii]|uniref:GNAT family N-acetyltransferase n=1 Tax=Corynebacterium mendelii TaxID=2765362 RepID=A0A939IXB8_9CORY|nr:hypothetical protein [Corynebacterium mendelii]MBN9644300.1 hypothetical protein [Corynebacterium mendelii]
MKAFSPAPVTADTIGLVHPQCLSTVFWETDPRYRVAVAGGDICFEKEAWLNRILIKRGAVGFLLADGGTAPAVATVLYCRSADAPVVEHLPTAPVGADAELVTSIHTDAHCHRAAVLMCLSAVVQALTERGVAALEIFGLRSMGRKHTRGGGRAHDPAVAAATVDHPLDPAVAESVLDPAAVGLVEVPLLREAGFRVVADHPVLPRLRLDLPPRQGLLADTARDDLTGDAVINT